MAKLWRFSHSNAPPSFHKSFILIGAEAAGAGCHMLEAPRGGVFGISDVLHVLPHDSYPERSS
jgi:hypothetical protein